MESQKSLKEDWLLWVLLLGAVVLTATYYVLAFESGSGEGTTRWLFEGVSKRTIQGLRKYRGDTLVLSVKRQNGDDWAITRPENVQVDPDAVNDWIGTILNPEVRRRFKASPEADYGIDETGVRLDVVQFRRTHSLYIGSNTPTGQGFYLRYGSARRAPVFLMAGSVKENIDRSLYDVRDKSLFDRKFQDLKAVSLESNGDSVTYRRGTDRWLISTGDTATLSETVSRSLNDDLRTILTTTAGSFYDTSTPEAYEPVQGVLYLVFGDGITHVRLGGKKDDERLMTIDDQPVVGVARDPVRTLQDLPGKPDGWPAVKDPEPTAKPSGAKSKRPSPERLKKLRRRIQQAPNQR